MPQRVIRYPIHSHTPHQLLQTLSTQLEFVYMCVYRYITGGFMYVNMFFSHVKEALHFQFYHFWLCYKTFFSFLSQGSVRCFISNLKASLGLSFPQHTQSHVDYQQ